ncbi:OLC1v1036817C1 [Oldenlandia corymbosa var. corymbosa]|uniref:OLC1v1036817C1 n=1 Tax=Oldenlandia corymbosa var. corymbosa TaxID=529605 RepID=A0AAV1CXJ8_OLDCO|nr:OLC1v1036817C1 [Oldenlandia corymbosa var. corymbosa]
MDYAEEMEPLVGRTLGDGPSLCDFLNVFFSSVQKFQPGCRPDPGHRRHDPGTKNPRYSCLILTGSSRSFSYARPLIHLARLLLNMCNFQQPQFLSFITGKVWAATDFSPNLLHIAAGFDVLSFLVVPIAFFH